MSKDIILVVGLGEIGHTLFSIYDEQKDAFSVNGIDIDEAKMSELGQDRSKMPSNVDVLQICIPCSNPDKFAQIIAEYVA